MRYLLPLFILCVTGAIWAAEGQGDGTIPLANADRSDLFEIRVSALETDMSHDGL